MTALRHLVVTGGFVLAALLSAAPAAAHMVSPDVGDFYAGLLHPLTAAEHLLPMLGLAFAAAQCGKAVARLAILLFPLALTTGIWAGAYAPAPQVAFYADVLATLLVGLEILLAPRLPASRILVVLTAVGLGLALGWRSGGDWAVSAAGWRFVPGVVLSGLGLIAVVAAWVPALVGAGGRGIRLVIGVGVVCFGLAAAWGVVGGAPAGGGLSRLPTEADLAALAQRAGHSPGLFTAALLGAFAWGAGHALTPGHGKALVGAYLVGSRGTPGQAILLGGLVTLTHTLGVFVLGGAAWLFSDSFGGQRFFPWLSLVSGLGVAAVGLGLLVSRLWALERRQGGTSGRDHTVLAHSHGGLSHSHGGLSHDHGASDRMQTGWRTLVALGISGGLVPCPGALVLLLGTLAVGQIGFGLVLVASFSLGLAVVLTVVGLLFIKGARVLETMPSFGLASRWLPIGAALAVAGLGMVLAAEAALGLWPG